MYANYANCKNDTMICMICVYNLQTAYMTEDVYAEWCADQQEKWFTNTVDVYFFYP